MNVHSVDEALKYLPGVYTNRPGGHEPSVMGTNVLLRGIPDYSRTLVLVDGQTLNDPYIGAVPGNRCRPRRLNASRWCPARFPRSMAAAPWAG